MIKYLVTDVDGTLTDGKLNFSENGELFKSFSVKDGVGIKEIATAKGIIPIVITARQSKIVTVRMQDLGVKHIYQGIEEKKIFLCELAKELGADFSEIAYIGDDINDLDCIKMCGVSACPADAVPEVIAVVDYVCISKGGEGAVREFIEMLNKTEEENTL